MKKMAVLLCILLTSCWWPAYHKELTAPYVLLAVDVDEQMMICYEYSDTACTGRIDETVFEVGWNEHYIVAKQHPKNDRSITNFYYIDIAKDGVHENPRTSVTGPLTEAEFNKKAQKLKLPPFTLLLDWLK